MAAYEGSRTASDVIAVLDFGMMASDSKQTGIVGNDGNNSSIVKFGGRCIDTVKGKSYNFENSNTVLSSDGAVIRTSMSVSAQTAGGNGKRF